MNIKKFSDVINNTDTSQEDKNKAIMGLMLENNLHVTANHKDEIHAVGEIFIEQVPKMLKKPELQAVLSWFADPRHNMFFGDGLKERAEAAIKDYKKAPEFKNHKKTLEKPPKIEPHKKVLSI